MNNQPYVSFFIDERSETSLLKKRIRKLSLQTGLSENQQDRLDIIVAELTSNFLKHTPAPREVLYRKIEQEGQAGVELIGIDHGPGMHDPRHMLQDGVSTTHSLGTGMGAIKRLSDQFDIYSQPAWGTLLLARIFQKVSPVRPADTRIDYASLLTAYPGEALCGDGLSYKKGAHTHTFLVTDGLGHGPHAHEASAQAAAAFQQSSLTDPKALLQLMHDRITHTRGAVGLVLTVDGLQQTIDYYGVGNISLRKITAEATKRGISTQGIIGQNVRKHLAATSLPWSANALLVVHSDGIDDHWKLSEYPGLMQRDLSLVAAVLYKDHKRGKDDCAILVIRINTTT